MDIEFIKKNWLTLLVLLGGLVAGYVRMESVVLNNSKEIMNNSKEIKNLTKIVESHMSVDAHHGALTTLRGIQVEMHALRQSNDKYMETLTDRITRLDIRLQRQWDEINRRTKP